MSEVNTGLHYPIKLDDLPPTWAAAFVGDFCDSIQSGFACGQHSDSNIGVPHLRPMNISRNGDLDFEIVKYVPSDFDERRLSEDDVLFNNTNSPELIGKTTYVTHKGHGLAFSNHMTRLRFHRGTNSKFGAYQLHYLWMARYFLHGCVKHVNQASVSATELAKSVPFVVPPLNEQHRIVAKIEELFSELDKGIEALKTAREQLKVYRQALLKHAFAGKLTAAWRAANPDKLEPAAALLARIQTERQQRYQQQLQQWEQSKSPLRPPFSKGGTATAPEQNGKTTSATASVPPFEKGKQGGFDEHPPLKKGGRGDLKPKAPKPLPPLSAEELAELPELPEGWAWTRLGNTNVDVTDGPFGSNLKSSDYVDRGVRVVRLENIGALEFIEDKESYVTGAKYELLKNHTVLPGDIVFSSFITENVRVALVPDSISKAINKADCFCVRLHGETLINRFAVMFLSTRHVYKQLEAQIHGVGRPRINTTQLKEVAIPVCGVEEQQAMLEQIESRLSEADQLDQTLTTSLQQSEALRQSILKRAFSGQLVAQDPHDEPAAMLLERIRTERAEKSAKSRKNSTGDKLSPTENKRA